MFTLFISLILIETSRNRKSTMAFRNRRKYYPNHIEVPHADAPAWEGLGSIHPLQHFECNVRSLPFFRQVLLELIPVGRATMQCFFQTASDADKIWVCAQAFPNCLENFVIKTRGFTSCPCCRILVGGIQRGHSDDAPCGRTNRRRATKRQRVKIRSLERNHAQAPWSRQRSALGRQRRCSFSRAQPPRCILDLDRRALPAFPESVSRFCGNGELSQPKVCDVSGFGWPRLSRLASLGAIYKPPIGGVLLLTCLRSKRYKWGVSSKRCGRLRHFDSRNTVKPTENTVKNQSETSKTSSRSSCQAPSLQLGENREDAGICTIQSAGSMLEIKRSILKKLSLRTGKENCFRDLP